MNEVRSFYASLAPRARLGLWLGAGAVLSLAAATVWWVLQPREQLLFGNLRERDAAEIVAQLDAWKVPHTIVDGGAGIQVGADQVYETRMRLVSAGVPRGGHVGFELFDDADFGVTEFAQRVNYQRALQGEIERTIAALPNVESARVHLSIRRPGLFLGEKETSKASVALTLQPGASLSRQQVGGIRSLVAAAVEGLTPSEVSVLNSDGSLLAEGGGVVHDAGLGTRTEDETRLEAAIQAKVTDLLRQVLPDGEFKVSVDATLNFDAVRQVSERPLGEGEDGNGLLRRRRSHSSNPADGSASQQNNEEAEYLHGTAREEISRAPGRIERLSVAVILPATLDEFQVPRLRALISAAAGVDPARGDLLEVSRVGRSAPFRISAASLPTTASTVPAPRTGTRAKTISSAVPLTRLLLVGAFGALLGMILMVGAQKRPRRLKPDEREAVLARMRGWLAEGSGA